MTERFVAQPANASWHGTITGYFGHRCRCIPCTGSAAAYQRQLRATNAERPLDQVPHGTLNGYNNYDCRCSRCRAAMREYSSRRRAQR